MIRPLTCICLLLALGSGLYLYQSKHQAQVLDRLITRTLNSADAARQRSGLLRAEYALLNDPSRLADLAHQLLPNLQTTSPDQYSTWADLDRRLPAIGAPPPAEPAPLEADAPTAELPKTTPPEAPRPEPRIAEAARPEAAHRETTRPAPEHVVVAERAAAPERMRAPERVVAPEHVVAMASPPRLRAMPARTQSVLVPPAPTAPRIAAPARPMVLAARRLREPPVPQTPVQAPAPMAVSMLGMARTMPVSTGYAGPNFTGGR